MKGGAWSNGGAPSGGAGGPFGGRTLCTTKHNNWPPICDAKAPTTTFGQHSMVPPFCANRTSVTAGTAREAPSGALHRWSTRPAAPLPHCRMQKLNANLQTPQGKRLQSNTVRTKGSSVTLSWAPSAETTEVPRGAALWAGSDVSV